MYMSYVTLYMYACTFDLQTDDSQRYGQTDREEQMSVCMFVSVCQSVCRLLCQSLSVSDCLMIVIICFNFIAELFYCSLSCLILILVSHLSLLTLYV